MHYCILSLFLECKANVLRSRLKVPEVYLSLPRIKHLFPRCNFNGFMCDGWALSLSFLE